MQLLIVIFLSILLLFLYVKFKYSHWKRQGIPYVEPKFPYGTLPLSKTSLHATQLEVMQYKKFKGHTPFAGLYFGLKPAVMAIDLDFIKRILITDFNSFHDRGFYYNEKYDPLSANLVNIGGLKWKKLRNKLTPTFTSGKMKYMFPTLMAVCSNFVNALNKEIKMGSEVEMRDFLARFGTDVIASCAFGLECNSLADPENEFRVTGRKHFSSPKYSKLMKFIFMSNQRLAKWLNVKPIRDDVSGFFMKILREIVDCREKTQIQRNDFMDMLIKMKNSVDPSEQLSFNEIAAQAFVFFLAGFETSSTVMSFALYELALNQNIQDRARKCVRDVLQRHQGKFTYESINEMTFVDQCLSESMRKYPPATALTRHVSQDYVYEDKVLRKGTVVSIPVYALHHDPDVWPEPNEFIPERFDPQQPVKRHPMSYIPFGDGPRNCIGLRFGLMQARLGLSHLLHNFKFTLSPKTPKSLNFRKDAHVLTPQECLFFHIEKISME